jgi:hypothetical protein
VAEIEREAFKRGIEHAITAGELLLEAKSQVAHGEWLSWLEDNCAMGLRTAQLYMQLAKHKREIREKCADVAYLTVSGALKLIAPKSKRKVVELAAPRTELVSQAHTRPFECTPSYDSDEEEAQELGGSLEELSDELREALIRANRLSSIISKMPKDKFRDERLPPLLAATIKNLQVLQQALLASAGSRMR